MEIHFISVGYGEAILLRDGAFTMLIDGGSAQTPDYMQPYAISAAQYLQQLGIKTLDLLLVTHIHEDHIGGVPAVLRTCGVREIWINILPMHSAGGLLQNIREAVLGNNSGKLFWSALSHFEEMRDEAASRNIPIRECGCEVNEITLTPGMRLTLLGMDEIQRSVLRKQYERLFSLYGDEALALFYEIDRQCNASSTAQYIKADGISALLTGDHVGDWDKLCTTYHLRADLLKPTHHGQRDGMPQSLLEAVDPHAFVICADRNRTYHSAHDEVLSRAKAYLRAHGRPEEAVYVTGRLEPLFAPPCAVCFFPGGSSMYYKNTSFSN